MRPILRHPLPAAALILALLPALFAALAPQRAEAFLYPQMFEHKDARTIRDRADEALAAKAFQEAVDLYTEAANTGDLDPADAAAAYEGRGRAWLALERPRQALADLRRSVEIAPGRASALVWRARAWLALGARKQAMEDAEDAVRACPECPQALLLRADLREAEGDRDGARADRDAARVSEEYTQ